MRPSRRLPGALVARAWLTRATFLWLGSRLLLTSALLLTPGGHFAGQLSTAIIAIGAAVAACEADVTRRHERVLLGNLGVGNGVLLALCVVPALAGEAALMFLATLVYP